MSVRETVLMLIEEERQFPHRTAAHLDACDAWLRDMVALVEQAATLPHRDTPMPSEFARIHERGREQEVMPDGSD